jgi:lipoprotein-releasing system permease protein
MLKTKKTKFNWVGFVAGRYILKKSGKSPASSKLSILEIAAGVLALTIIISVMNGFQLGFIENILEISSYYVRVDNFNRDNIDLIDKIKKINGVKSVVPFKETQGVLSGVIEGIQIPVVARGLPASAFSEDLGMSAQIKFLEVDGEINSLLKNKKAIVIGSELKENLALEIGDAVDLLSISNLFSVDEEESSSFVVAGVFTSGFYEYDAHWCFINIDSAINIEGGIDSVSLGIKLNDRYADLKAVQNIKAVIEKEMTEESVTNSEINSWRDYNKSFFSALKTEKSLMFVLVGLIFIVVALNIFQAQKRSVLERSEEIGLLRALGATDFQVRCVFAFNGLIVGAIGATSGIVLALFITTHINEFFDIVEMVVNFGRQLYMQITGLFSSDQDFAVFNKQDFYLQEIPARIMAADIILIYLFGLLSAVFATWFASRGISKIKPADVLRYE